MSDIPQAVEAITGIWFSRTNSMAQAEVYIGLADFYRADCYWPVSLLRNHNHLRAAPKQKSAPALHGYACAKGFDYEN